MQKRSFKPISKVLARLLKINLKGTAPLYSDKGERSRKTSQKKSDQLFHDSKAVSGTLEGILGEILFVDCPFCADCFGCGN